jgi:Double zinc ribbon/FHA domain
MNNCKICSHKNQVNATSCFKCGALLTKPDSSKNTKIGLKFQQDSSEYCKKCTYPLSKDTTECPNCGSVNHLVVVPPIVEQPLVAPTENKTIRLQDIVLSPDKLPIITLVPVKKPDSKLSFEGTKIALDRAALNPNNRSISSQNHAILTSEDNRWYITDQSSNEATFVQVKGKVELTNQIQILIGNEFFCVEILS